MPETKSPPAMTSQQNGTAYDAHHPPAPEIIDKCVHCGFCLPTCPTYLLWHQEMDSPRGRIYLMKMAGEGGVAKMDATFVSHFDRCLGCMACMSACPSGVEYGKLIEATRPQIERNFRRSLADRLFRRLIFAVFPHPARLRVLMFPLWLYQRMGLRWLLRASGLLRLLPSRLRSMESLLPELTWQGLSAAVPRAVAPPRTAVKRRVGVLLGCVQRVFFSEVNAATVRVLSALGCEVVISAEQGCCGALMSHSGREADAMAAARKLIEVFEQSEVDTIVINSAGCGSSMKEYAHLFRDDPEFAERARAISAKCRDVSEIVAELGLGEAPRPLRMRVAYQDACHLQHAQGIQAQPRAVLRAIPGLEVMELPESAVCCGSAGIHNLVEPETARQLADRKAQFIIASGAEALVSANPGCMLHIAGALRRAGHPVPVFHLVELVDRALEPKLRGGEKS